MSPADRAKLRELDIEQLQLDRARAALHGRGLTFAQSVKAVLVEEFARTADEADALVSIYPNVVMQGIFVGPHAIRATAMALEIVELDDVRRAGGEAVGPGDRMVR